MTPTIAKKIEEAVKEFESKCIDSKLNIVQYKWLADFFSQALTAITQQSVEETLKAVKEEVSKFNEAYDNFLNTCNQTAITKDSETRAGGEILRQNAMNILKSREQNFLKVVQSQQAKEKAFREKL